MLYFAYGSNLDLDRMKERCPTAQFIGYGEMQGFKLVFQNNNRGKIVANIIKGKKSDVVEGVVYDIRGSKDIKTLDGCEGHPHVYKRTMVDVKMEHLVVPIEMQTYIMEQYRFEKDGMIQTEDNRWIQGYKKVKRYFGYPSEDYLHHIAKGYDDWALDTVRLAEVLEEMKKKAKKVEKPSDTQKHNVDKVSTEGKYKVFVYGTLMKGLRNSHFLKHGKYLGEAVLDGAELYDLPYGFPALKRAEDNVVAGEVYEVDDLTGLDRLEGYDEETHDGMYLRKSDLVKMENGEEVDVFYYLWNRELPQGSIYVDSGEKWFEDMFIRN